MNHALPHCEERSGETIQRDWVEAHHSIPLDCFNALAMTDRVIKTAPMLAPRRKPWQTGDVSRFSLPNAPSTGRVRS